MADCGGIQSEISSIQDQIEESRGGFDDTEDGPGGHRPLHPRPRRPVPPELLRRLAELKAQLAHCTTPGIYRCDDGAAYYASQVGSTFTWFGERVDGAFANVFIGQRTDNTVSGRWFDVPKGATTATGTLTITVDDRAGTLTRVSQTGGFGGSHWQLDHPFGTDKLPRASTLFRRARFQGDPEHDLTGTWMTHDGGTAYVREIPSVGGPQGTAIAWFEESTHGCHVFVGTVDRARTTVTGSWTTLPKIGVPGQSGTATLQISSEAKLTAAELIRTSGALPFERMDRVEALDVVVHLDRLTILHDVANIPRFVAGPPFQTTLPGSHVPGHFELRAESGDEPYLWTFFATIDGKNVSLQNLATARAFVSSTSGSHNNLTPRENLPAGTVLPIPANVGRFSTTLVTIRGLSRSVAKSATTLVTGAIALEEDDTENSAMENGRAALVRALQDKLDGAIHSMQAPTPDTVAQWTAELQKVAKDAVKGSLGTWDKILVFLGFQDPDDVVGSANDIASYGDLETARGSVRQIAFDYPATVPAYHVVGRIDVTAARAAPSGLVMATTGVLTTG